MTVVVYHHIEQNEDRNTFNLTFLEFPAGAKEAGEANVMLVSKLVQL